MASTTNLSDQRDLRSSGHLRADVNRLMACLRVSLGNQQAPTDCRYNRPLTIAFRQARKLKVQQFDERIGR